MFKVLTLLLVMVLAFSLLYGCTNTRSSTETEPTEGITTQPAEQTTTTEPLKRIKIQVAKSWPSNPAPPADNILEKYVAERLLEETGVEAEYIEYPPDTTDLQYVTMMQAAGTLPHVLLAFHFNQNGEAMEYVEKDQFAYEINSSFINQYMPKLKARLEQYGMSVEEYTKETVGNDGKNWFLNGWTNPSVFPELADHPMAVQFGAHQFIYHVYMRDDILKQIFPNARTENEMLELYKSKGGALSVEDIVGDIPIRSMEDFYNYAKEVKNLNVKVGDKPVIPWAGNSSSEGVNSVDWSLTTATGLTHRWPLVFQEPPQRSFFRRTSEEYMKPYLYWLNRMYNEGMMDPEIFIMKDDQYRAKAINGEYAVINGWLPVSEAKEVGAERGYGYRYFPVFYPLEYKDNLNNSMAYAGVRDASVLLTKTIKEDELAQVAAWMDFFMSEESDEIAYWGHPDWYTGEGANRRYKPEYKELENWTLYGTTGGKDGDYYGLVGSFAIPSDWGRTWRPSIKPFSLFNTSQGYPDSPYFVYERDTLSAPGFDVGMASHDIIMQDNTKNMDMFLQTGWNDFLLNNTPEWTELDKKLAVAQPDAGALLIEVITGPDDKFEENWEAYVKLYKDSGLEEALDALNELFADIYQNKILPNKIRDGAWRN